MKHFFCKLMTMCNHKYLTRIYALIGNAYLYMKCSNLDRILIDKCILYPHTIAIDNMYISRRI